MSQDGRHPRGHRMLTFLHSTTMYQSFKLFSFNAVVLTLSRDTCNAFRKKDLYCIIKKTVCCCCFRALRLHESSRNRVVMSFQSVCVCVCKYVWTCMCVRVGLQCWSQNNVHTVSHSVDMLHRLLYVSPTDSFYFNHRIMLSWYWWHHHT